MGVGSDVGGQDGGDDRRGGYNLWVVGVRLEIEELDVRSVGLELGGCVSVVGTVAGWGRELSELLGTEVKDKGGIKDGSLWGEPDSGGVRREMTQGQAQKRPEWKRPGHQRANKEGVGKGQMVKEKETGEK